mmetsp:Transcript_14539/g.36093  ORF Transcript_14539/g.36093 Transcript_14539/m.36093 type:complete len:273 (-) Transcript_14539:53-871(-)
MDRVARPLRRSAPVQRAGRQRRRRVRQAAHVRHRGGRRRGVRGHAARRPRLLRRPRSADPVLRQGRARHARHGRLRCGAHHACRARRAGRAPGRQLGGGAELGDALPGGAACDRAARDGAPASREAAAAAAAAALSPQRQRDYKCAPSAACAARRGVQGGQGPQPFRAPGAVERRLHGHGAAHAPLALGQVACLLLPCRVAPRPRRSPGEPAWRPSGRSNGHRHDVRARHGGGARGSCHPHPLVGVLGREITVGTAGRRRSVGWTRWGVAGR